MIGQFFKFLAFIWMVAELQTTMATLSKEEIDELAKFKLPEAKMNPAEYVQRRVYQHLPRKQRHKIIKEKEQNPAQFASNQTENEAEMKQRNDNMKSSNTLVLQVDTRSMHELSNCEMQVSPKSKSKISVDLTIPMRINAAYAEHQGYDYQYIRDESNSIAPYWIKAFKVKELLLNNSHHYDYILYLDTDAVIHHTSFNTTIESFFEEGKSFVYAGQPKGTGDHWNAGVWIVKNTPESIKIMEAWTGKIAEPYISAWSYDPSANCGKKSCHHWSCHDVKLKKAPKEDLRWHGFNFCGGSVSLYSVQGFFQFHLLENDTFGLRKYTSLCRWQILNNPNAPHGVMNDTFVNHFWRYYKKNIVKYLETVPRKLYEQMFE